MVLAELGQKITGALRKLNTVTVIDDKVRKFVYQPSRYSLKY